MQAQAHTITLQPPIHVSIHDHTYITNDIHKHMQGKHGSQEEGSRRSSGSEEEEEEGGMCMCACIHACTLCIVCMGMV